MVIGEQPSGPVDGATKPKSGWSRFWRLVFSTETWPLWKVAGIFIFLGLFFYLLEGALKPSDPVLKIIEHMSVAFWVAAFSVIGIEIRAKRRDREELDKFVGEFQQFKGDVARNVFDAVIGQIVPPPMVEEVKELLRSPFMKTKCEYTIRFLHRTDDMPPNLFRLRRDLRFKIHNLSAHPETFLVRSSHTVDENIDEAVLKDRKFHLLLAINNVAVENLKDYLKDEKGRDLEYPVPLDPKGSAGIFLSSEEVMRIEANRNFYSQGSPVDALAVSIENECREFIGNIEVQMHHPGKGEVIDEQPDRHRLPRAFFPGQGFEVSWKKIGTPETNATAGTRPEEIPQALAASPTAEPHPLKPRAKGPEGQGDLPL